MASAKRELFKSPDVCEMAQLQSYVLRSWEAEFPGLGQPATGGGRIYRRADVELVLRIKQLVFDEGLTLAGARRRLEEQNEPSVAAGAVEHVLGGMARSKLRQVRTGLEAIMRLLSRDSDRQRDLQLVPRPASVARARATHKRSMPVARRSTKRAAKTSAGKRRRSA